MSRAAALEAVHIQDPLGEADWWDQTWLPHYPLAADVLSHGIYPTERDRALTMRFIQANPRALQNLLVVDIDHVDGALRALEDSVGLVPNLITENPSNGHCHAVWALREPVTTTEVAHRKPMYLAASVIEGLRRKTDGDLGYSGLMTKNPLSESWVPWWGPQDLYSLNDLRTALGPEFMPKFGWWRGKRGKRGEQTGLGRNCSLFEDLRLRAYRLVRHYWFDSGGLYDALLAETLAANAEFADPLPESEAIGIARSIHRWITTESRIWADGPLVYEANFSAIQSVRGKRSGEKRAAAAERTRERLVEIQQQQILTGSEALTMRQIAEAAGVSLRTAKHHLSIPRSEYLANAERVRESALVLWAGGMSMSEIGEVLGRNRSTIYRALTRL